MIGGNKLVKPLLSSKDKDILAEIYEFLSKLAKSRQENK